MKKEMLIIWDVAGYAEEGGGTEYDFCEEDEAEEFVNKLQARDPPREVLVCALVSEYFDIKPIEIIKKVKLVPQGEI